MPNVQLYMIFTASGWMTYTGGQRKVAESLAQSNAAKVAASINEVCTAFVFAVPPFARLKFAGPKGAGRYPVKLPRAMAVGVRYIGVAADGKVAYKGTLTVSRTLMLFGRHFSTDSFTAADVARIEREAAKHK